MPPVAKEENTPADNSVGVAQEVPAGPTSVPDVPYGFDVPEPAPTTPPADKKPDA